MGGSFVPNKMHSTFERRTARPLTTPEQQQQRSLSEATLKHKMLYREEEEKAADSKSQQESRNTDVKDWNADEDSRKRDQQANKKEKEIPSEASEREREREGGTKRRRLGLTFQETRITHFFLPPTTPTIYTPLALFPLHLPHTHKRLVAQAKANNTPPPTTPTGLRQTG
jgi:hypothetical protein